VLFPSVDAVILQTPAPVVVPLVVHGPDAEKVTVCAGAEDDALNVNVLPYCTAGNGAKVIVCGNKPELCGRIVKAPETAMAAL
jgi:hypothetical protein